MIEKPARIAQKHPFGCAIACVAMATGLDYDEIIKDFSGYNFNEGGVDHQCVEDYLAERGYATRRIFVHAGYKRKDRDVWPCAPFADVHIVCGVRDGYGHSVIWLRDGTVIDPARENPGPLDKLEKLYSIAAIYKVAP